MLVGRIKASLPYIKWEVSQSSQVESVSTLLEKSSSTLAFIVFLCFSPGASAGGSFLFFVPFLPRCGCCFFRRALVHVLLQRVLFGSCL